jgi:hypothetical protein
MLVAIALDVQRFWYRVILRLLILGGSQGTTEFREELREESDDEVRVKPTLLVPVPVDVEEQQPWLVRLKFLRLLNELEQGLRSLFKAFVAIDTVVYSSDST